MRFLAPALAALFAAQTVACACGGMEPPDGSVDAGLLDGATEVDGGVQVTYGSCRHGAMCGPEAECLRVRVGRIDETRVGNECTRTCESPSDCPPVPNYPDQPVDCRSFGGEPALCFVGCEDGFTCLLYQDCVDVGGTRLCIPAERL